MKKLFLALMVLGLFACNKETIQPKEALENEQADIPIDPECMGCRRQFQDTVKIIMPNGHIPLPGVVGIPFPDTIVVTVGKGVPNKPFRP